MRTITSTVYSCLLILAMCAGVPESAAAQESKPAMHYSPEQIDTINQSARHVSVGYDQGVWGNDAPFIQGLKVTIPFDLHWGMRVRPLVLHANAPDGDYDPALIGRIDLYGSTPVLGGIVRVYGGGGPQIGYRPGYGPSSAGEELNVGGGGFFGFEFFLSRRTTFHLEVGGQSAAHGRGLGDGHSTMAGVNWYF